MKTILEAQKEICKRFSAIHFPCGEDLSVYFASETKGLLPLNGERVKGLDGESGWYIWCGAERHDRDDFFEQISVFDLSQRAPLASAFLGLPTGFKFLIAGGHKRAWLEPSLLSSEEVQNESEPGA